MASYNYKNLDTAGFEALAKDVLERILNCKLERFGTGKDGGIDLCDDIKKKTIVVQCKNYQQSSFSKLYSVLCNEEKEKLVKMNPRPEKYYIFTSLELLPQQKEKIRDLFQDYMDDDSFIIDGISINEFFEETHNHDLVLKHNKLFISLPESFTNLLVNTEEIQNETVMQIYKTLFYEFEDCYPSFVEFTKKNDISAFIRGVVNQFNSIQLRTLSDKAIRTGVLASIAKSAYLYQKNVVKNEKYDNIPCDKEYDFYTEEISISVADLLNMARTDDLLELSKRSNKIFHRSNINKEEKSAIAFAAFCLYFTDLFWIIRRYPAEHEDMIKYKTNADVCQKLPFFTEHVSFQKNPVELDSSKRRIDICLLCDEANSHKAAALFVNEFERFLNVFEDVFSYLGVQFYYVRASILSLGQDHISNQNFEAYTPTLMPLLSGGHLYSSKLTFIRELTQNSIDSMSVRRRLKNDDFDAKITVSLTVNAVSGRVSSLSFNDTGIGMGKTEIERYLTSIGRSFYTSRDFKKMNLEYSPISYFGIGFLSCFMDGHAIEINTRSVEYDKSYHLSIPNIEGCFFVEEIEKIIPYGTDIQMHMKKDSSITIFDIVEYAWIHFLDMSYEISFSWDGLEMMLLALKDADNNQPKISHLDIAQYVRKHEQKPPCSFSFVNDKLLLPKNGVHDFIHLWWNRNIRRQYGGIELSDNNEKFISYSIPPHSGRCPGNSFFLFLSFNKNGEAAFYPAEDVKQTFEYEYGIFITDLPLAGMKNRSKENGMKPYSGRLRIMNSGILVDDASLESVFGENMRIYSNDQETAYNDVLINFPPGWIDLNVAREKIICLSSTNVDKKKLLITIASSTIKALNYFMDCRKNIPIVNVQEIASFITVICGDINNDSSGEGKKLLTELKKKKFLLKMNTLSEGICYEMFEDNGEDMDMKSWFKANNSQNERNRQTCNAMLSEHFFKEFESKLAQKRVEDIEEVNSGLAEMFNLPEEYCKDLNQELALVAFSAYLIYFPENRIASKSVKAAHSRLALERQLMKKYNLNDFSSGHMKWIITNNTVADFIEILIQHKKEFVSYFVGKRDE